MKSNEATIIRLRDNADEHAAVLGDEIMMADSYYTNYQQEASSYFRFVVTSRKLSFAIANHKCETLGLWAKGYRRIGNNT